MCGRRTTEVASGCFTLPCLRKVGVGVFLCVWLFVLLLVVFVLLVAVCFYFP